MRAPWAALEAADIAGPLEPGYVQLAASLCSLPFVPFPLLRAVRRYICPEVSERLLCESPLVDGVSADGISLDPGVCGPLRQRVRALYAQTTGTAEAAALEALRAILDAHSRVLSPLVAIEERILWEWLTTTDSDELRQVCDQHLRDVIGTAVLEQRQKIYRWASAAAGRLPVECFESDLGWLLGELCRTRRIPFPAIAPPHGALNGSGPLNVLASGLPDWPLGLHRDGEYLELGPVNGRRRVAVPVVDTDPIAVRIEAVGQESRKATLWLPRRRAARIPVGRAAMTITDLRSRTYLLASFAGDEAPETEEARKALESAIAHQASQEVVRFVVLRPTRSGYVVSLPDVGCTALLAESELRLQPGDDGYGNVVDVIAEQGRVILRRDLRETHVLSQRRIPRSALLSEIPSRFQAVVWKLGKSSGKRRSVHVLLPEDHPLWSFSPDGVGRIRFANAAHRNADGTWGPEPGSVVDVNVVSIDDRYVVLTLDLERAPRTREISLRGQGSRSFDPVAAWLAPETLHAGQELDLIVDGIVKFGVFCRLPDGRKALLHVTNIYPRSHREVSPYNPGDSVRVRIQSIDPGKRRISLTQEPVWVSSAVGQEMEIEVTSVVQFGVFLALPDGREGLLHVSEMLPPQDPGSYQPGDLLRVRVIGDDAERRRISFTQLP